MESKQSKVVFFWFGSFLRNLKLDRGFYHTGSYVEAASAQKALDAALEGRMGTVTKPKARKMRHKKRKRKKLAFLKIVFFNFQLSPLQALFPSSRWSPVRCFRRLISMGHLFFQSDAWNFQMYSFRIGSVPTGPCACQVSTCWFKAVESSAGLLFVSFCEHMSQVGGQQTAPGTWVLKGCGYTFILANASGFCIPYQFAPGVCMCFSVFCGFPCRHSTIGLFQCERVAWRWGFWAGGWYPCEDVWETWSLGPPSQ